MKTSVLDWPLVLDRTTFKVDLAGVVEAVAASEEIVEVAAEVVVVEEVDFVEDEVVIQSPIDVSCYRTVSDLARGATPQVQND